MILSNVLDKLLVFVPSGLRSIVESIIKGILGLKAAPMRFRRELVAQGVDFGEEIRSFLAQLHVQPQFVLLILQDAVRAGINALNALIRYDVFNYANGFVAIDPSELKSAVLTQYQKLSNVYCANAMFVCDYLAKTWTPKHTQEFDSIISDVHVPVRYDNVKEMASADVTDPVDVVFAAVGHLGTDFGAILKRLLWLNDDLLGRLRDRLHNPIMRLLIFKFTSMPPKEVDALLSQFQDDVRTYMINVL